MGFIHPEHEGLLAQLSPALDERGNVHPTTDTSQTTLPGIFAAGDVRKGQSLVVWAIADGRDCARKVDAYLIETR